MSRKTPLRTAFLTISIFLLCFSACAYEAKTHGKSARLASELVQRTDSLNIYKELYDRGYASQIMAGAEAGDFGNVDGNNRSFRHYYDPYANTSQKGLKYFDYYQLWAHFDVIKNLIWQSQGRWIDDMEITPPKSGYYDDALEWARNSAGAADMMNWEGALRVYDYTTSSRGQAYRRLGYVSHLAADMAQPDYVFGYPHPGSSYRREEGGKVYYGFEALVENYIDDVDFSGKEVKKLSSLDDYFNEMARAAKRTGSPARYVLPLGLKTQTLSGAKDVAIIPAIDDSKPGGRKKYLDLARELLDQAVEYNAGILELFYDIVNQPPYVADVTVTQSGEGRYHGWYEEMYDDIREQLAGVINPAVYKRVSARSLRKKASPIDSGKKALVRVTFGPTEDIEEHIDPASVKVLVGDIEVPGAMTGPRTWEGEFTYNFESKEPEKTFPIKISAKDIHNHFPRAGLSAQGYELDSNPETPARLSGYVPPYPWKDYEPGADANHSIVIRQIVPPPIAESIEVFSQGTYFVRSRWIAPSAAEARKGKEALLEKDSSGVKDGVELGKTDSATVRITFSQIMDDGTLRLKLGGVDLPLSKTGEFTYEAIIPLEEFNRPGSDQAYRFEITGKGISGLELDAQPGTVAVFNDKANRWIALESGPDTTHSLRIYGEFGKAALKGIVHEMELVSPSGRPVAGKPLAGWNVVIYVGSIEVDQSLCEEALRLARLAGIGEHKEDPKALNLLKDKVKSSCRLLYGTMPGWIVKTDSEGKFTFPLYKYPGLDGVIEAYYTFFVFPPDNVETYDPRSMVSDTLSCDIFFPRGRSRNLDDVSIEIALTGEKGDYKQSPVLSVYEIGGTVSGEEMAPPVKNGYTTEVHLIKRGLDESRTKESVTALSVDTHDRLITGDLTDPKSHQPPYKFRFSEKIPEHLAINRYVRISTGSLVVKPVGAGPVLFELSPNGDSKKFTDEAIDTLWNNFTAGK
ncbi:MAG: hypothetical protein NTY76_00350 [Candidatus Omnitrophica bacterium]|nr:hypothetical protein [Candidatus Omnitrophota bacterium]